MYRTAYEGHLDCQWTDLRQIASDREECMQVLPARKSTTEPKSRFCPAHQSPGQYLALAEYVRSCSVMRGEEIWESVQDKDGWN